MLCILTLNDWWSSVRHMNLPRLFVWALGIWILLSAFLGSEVGRVNEQGVSMAIVGPLRYEGLISQMCYLAVFLIFSVLPLRGAERPILGTAALALVMYGVIVFCQYLDINVLDLFPDGRNIYTNYEFQGPIGNIDMVTGYICLVMPLILIPWVFGKGSFYLPLASMTGVLLLCLFEVQSGILALVALALFLGSTAVLFPDHRRRSLQALSGICLCFCFRFFVFLPWLDGEGSLAFVFRPVALLFLVAGIAFAALSCIEDTWRLSFRTLVICLAALFIMVLLLVWFIPFGDGGLYELHEILHGRGEDAFGSWRWGVWRISLGMSTQQLLFGTGPGMYYYGFQSYQNAAGQAIPQSFDNPHNLFLGLLTQSGLPALILFIAILVCLFVGLHRNRSPFAVGLSVSIFLYMVQGFFTFSTCLVSPMLFAVMGMACSLGGGVDDSLNGEAEKRLSQSAAPER